jgi:FkbM family methyltransferase
MNVVRDATVGLVNRVPGRVAAPFRSGRLLSRLAAPILELALPHEMTEITVRSGPARGIRLKIDVQHEKFYWTGAYERAVQDALVELVQAGDVVWDIGAHAGFFTVLVSRLVGPSGEVLAFEPVSDNRSRLNDSLKLNSAENVVVRCEAVGSSCGRVMLHPRGSSLTWTLRDEETETSSNSFMVSCVALDDVATNAKPPALIKIDAEDAEVEVLRGAIGLISRHTPYVVIELLDPRLLDECLSIASGYTVRSLDARHWLLLPPAADGA